MGEKTSGIMEIDIGNNRDETSENIEINMRNYGDIT